MRFSFLPCRSAKRRTIPDTTKPRNVRKRFCFRSGDVSMKFFKASVDVESLLSVAVLNSKYG